MRGWREAGWRGVDGNASNTDTCTNACKAATCGDGFTAPGEECDDGNALDTDACTKGCKNPTCGDGFVGPGEECDDANAVNTDACLDTCKNATCGDGFLQPAEACDDGNTYDKDGCSNTCVVRTGIELGYDCYPGPLAEIVPVANGCTDVDPSVANAISRVVFPADLPAGTVVTLYDTVGCKGGSYVWTASSFCSAQFKDVNAANVGTINDRVKAVRVALP